MKKFLTSSFLVVFAFFSMFCLVGCGDEFANAEEVTQEEVATYINQEGVDFGEGLSKGFVMKMKTKSKRANLDCEIGILLDEQGEDIESLSAFIGVGSGMFRVEIKAYVKDGMLYTSMTGEGKQVVEFTGQTGIDSIIDAISEVDKMLEQVRDYVISNDIDLSKVGFKKLVGEEEGDIKFQIKDKQENAESTFVIAFENNVLQELKVNAESKEGKVEISFARTTQLKLPSDKELANWR